MLRDTYGDQPRAVAEALRSLRQLRGAGGSWLARVLHGRPELGALAEAVGHALTGG